MYVCIYIYIYAQLRPRKSEAPEILVMHMFKVRGTYTIV